MSEPAGAEPGTHFAQTRALAVLRVRGTALAMALLPAAGAVVLLAADATGWIGGPGWDAVRWTFVAAACAALALAALVAAVLVRAEPAVSPTVDVAERTAPDLYRLVRDLADRLDVPAPSAIALTPDCDSWLEDRSHRSRSTSAKRGHPSTSSAVADRRARAGPAAPAVAPVLVIGSPFLWWMRVAELRAVLAPVVAGTGPSAHPDIAAARRFVRALDAAMAVSAGHFALSPVGWAARMMLRGCRVQAEEMERGVATAASARAKAVDYGQRIVAQEQVGLAYAGWDRLLTRVALPAWRMGRWPARLDAGVVSALTELSRRDRLAEGFTSRLGERPACDLLEAPGAVDEAASLLAARLFHGGPAEPGPGWTPVDWDAYPEEVVDRKWRLESARLHAVLDDLDTAAAAAPHAPSAAASAASPGSVARPVSGPTLDRVIEALTAEAETTGGQSDHVSTGVGTPGSEAIHDQDRAHQDRAHQDPAHQGAGDPHGEGPVTSNAARVSAAIAAHLAQEEAAGHHSSAPSAEALDGPTEGYVPLFPLQAPRTGRELLAEHVTAMVCCAAVDTAGAVPGLDWLDGPVLLFRGGRRAALSSAVLRLVEEGDADPLRDWLSEAGVRTDKPVRLG